MFSQNKRNHDSEHDSEHTTDYETDDEEPLGDDRTYFESSDDSFQDSSDEEEYVHERSSDPTYSKFFIRKMSAMKTNEHLGIVLAHICARKFSFFDNLF